MNHIAGQDTTELVIRSIIDRHDLPSFVRGYEVWLDEFDGTPGFWVRFNVPPMRDTTAADIEERGRALVAIQTLLEPEFKEKVDRFPFFRFAEVEPSPAASCNPSNSLPSPLRTSRRRTHCV